MIEPTESPALISEASRDFWRQVFASERRAYLEANGLDEDDEEDCE